MYSLRLEWTENLWELRNLSLQGVELNMTEEQLEAPLSRFHTLRHLNLKLCALYGQLPKALQNLTSLSNFQLSWNDFTSKVPLWLGNMTALVSICLDNCCLIGPFPASVSHFPHLKELMLADNEITGNISQILLCEGWPHLTRFSLWSSSGSLPPCIGNISGQIPASIGLLSSLIYLRLSNNLLNDNVPFELGMISSLEELYLDNNQLNGNIPTSLGRLHQISRINLSNNNLEGYFFLHFFENVKRLVELRLSNNKLTIHIEPEWIPPMQFERLKLGSCNIGGPFPAFLSTQLSLWFLDLANNSLYGNIPSWVGDLPSLQVLYLSNNNL